MVKFCRSKIKNFDFVFFLRFCFFCSLICIFWGIDVIMTKGMYECSVILNHEGLSTTVPECMYEVNPIYSDVVRNVCMNDLT